MIIALSIICGVLFIMLCSALYLIRHLYRQVYHMFEAMTQMRTNFDKGLMVLRDDIQGVVDKVISPTTKPPEELPGQGPDDWSDPDWWKRE